MPMNPQDIAGLNALQSAFAYNPFGEPGYGPLFGPLPQMQTLPYGSLQTGGGTFFGPQVYTPHHLSLGSGMFGQLGGFGIEQYALNRGYSYMPVGVNPMDMWRAREQESDRYRFMSMGQSVDEHRLARAIEQGFKAATGSATVTSGMASTAASLANANFMPLYATGMLGMMPGGSATDFMANMWSATRNIGVNGANGFQLGMPVDQALQMSNRLLNVLAPGGQWDPRRMRNMSFGDMGQLASTLTTYGLLDTNVTDSDLTGYLGGSAASLSSSQLAGTKNVVQISKMAKQLKSYADVMGTMKELLGDQDAPLDKILSTMQQLTGNGIQQYDPGQLQTMMLRIKEMARAANISLTTMMEVAKTGAAMAQSAGMYGPLGTQLGITSAMQTVAGQTAVTGAFPGRMSPDEYSNVVNQWNTRGVTSPAARVSVQTLRMLDELNTSGMNDYQRNIVADLRNRANSLSLNENNIGFVTGRLQELGIGPSVAGLRLFSNNQVQQYLADNPNLLQNMRGAQFGDVANLIGLAAQSLGGGFSSDNSTLAQGVRGAAGRNMSAFLAAVGQSYMHSPTGSVSGRMEWLRRQGWNVSGINGEQLFGAVEATEGMQSVLAGSGIKDATGQKLSAYMYVGQLDAQRAMTQQADIGVAGQKMLADLKIDSRSTLLQRFLGAASQNTGSTESILAAGFGFAPMRQLREQIDAAGGQAVAAAVHEYQTAATPEAKEAARKKLTTVVQSFEDVTRQSNAAFADPSRMTGTQAVLNKFDARDVRAFALFENDPTQSTKAMHGVSAQHVIGRLAERFSGLTDEDIRRVETEIGGAEGSRVGKWLTSAQLAGRRIMQTGVEEASDKEIFAAANNIYSTMLRAAEDGMATQQRPTNPKEQMELFNRIQAARKELSEAKTPQEARAALKKLRTLAMEAKGSVVENGALGKKFMATMAMNAKGLSKEERAEYYKSLGEVGVGMMKDLADATDDLMSDEDALKSAQSRYSPAYTSSRKTAALRQAAVGFKAKELEERATFDETEWAFITGDKNAVAPYEGDRHKHIDESRRSHLTAVRDAAAQYGTLKDILSKTGKITSAQMVNELVTQLQNTHLFKDGKMTDELKDYLASSGDEGAMATMEELAKYSTAGLSREERQKILQKAADAEKNAENVKAGADKAKADTESAQKGGSKAVNIIFKQNGKEIGETLTVEVQAVNPAKDTGREATDYNNAKAG